MYLCAFLFSYPSTSIIRKTVRLNSAFEFKFERQKAWPQYILNHYSLLCFSEIRFHGYSPSPAKRTSRESDQCLNNAKLCPQKWKLSVMVLSRFHYILLTRSRHFQTTIHFLPFFRMILLPNSPEIILPPHASSVCKTAYTTLWKPYSQSLVPLVYNFNLFSLSVKVIRSIVGPVM